jgi:hypothetical protein
MFSLMLIWRPAKMMPYDLGLLREALSMRPVRSFWGHRDTVQAASRLLGVRVDPASERPVITLTDDGYPMLEGEVFKECFVLSPDYRAGFRPAVGSEVSPEDIRGWQVLRIVWEYCCLRKG